MRRRVQQTFSKPSRTKQAMKEACDVNNILKKYQKTQLITHVNKINGQYGDFSEVLDFQSSLNALRSAEEAFLGLPSSIRKRFSNDPGELLAFLSDSSNKDEALKLGLLKQDALKNDDSNNDITASSSSTANSPS